MRAGVHLAPAEGGHPVQRGYEPHSQHQGAQEGQKFDFFLLWPIAIQEEPVGVPRGLRGQFGGDRGHRRVVRGPSEAVPPQGRCMRRRRPLPRGAGVRRRLEARPIRLRGVQDRALRRPEVAALKLQPAVGDASGVLR